MCKTRRRKGDRAYQSKGNGKQRKGVMPQLSGACDSGAAADGCPTGYPDPGKKKKKGGETARNSRKSRAYRGR